MVEKREPERITLVLSGGDLSLMGYSDVVRVMIVSGDGPCPNWMGVNVRWPEWHSAIARLMEADSENPDVAIGRALARGMFSEYLAKLSRRFDEDLAAYLSDPVPAWRLDEPAEGPPGGY